MSQNPQDIEQLESRKAALERILRATLHLPAQVTFYGFALGAIVLLGGGGLPAALAPLASSLGGNILASILERVARGEDVAPEELQKGVQDAIAHSGDIAQLLKIDQQNQAQLAHVIRKLSLIRTLQQQGTYDILRRIDEQSTAFVELRHELHSEFSGIQEQLKSISESQELQATKEDLEHHTEFLSTQIDQIYKRFDAIEGIPQFQPHLMSRDSLLAAIYQASAELRNCQVDIGGIELERTEVREIVQWIQNANSKEDFAVLHDRPGMGKTVVMVGILRELEALGIPVLAIKADNLDGNLKTPAELSRRLKLAAPIEDCAQSLAKDTFFVVLVDQVDALSFNFSYETTTLGLILATLDHLTAIDGVKVIASCRTFDLRTNSQLSSRKPDRAFELCPLSDEQIDRVLVAAGLTPDALRPQLRKLLSVPQHLKIFFQIVESSAQASTYESLSSMHALYETLWQTVVMSERSHSQALTGRQAAIYELLDFMYRHHVTSAPAAVLDDYIEARTYLQHIDFIRFEGNSWKFSHPTLLDFCYARRYAASGARISETILASPQGFDERSQLLYVLAYLRGTSPAQYVQEIRKLLSAPTLRFHLSQMLVEWLGNLPDPKPEDLRIARELIASNEFRQRFLQASGGNRSWLDLLVEQDIQPLLASKHVDRVNQGVQFLSSFFSHAETQLIELLEPYLNRNEDWDNRIAYCLSRIEDWRHTPRALDILCSLLEQGRITDGHLRDRCFRHVASSFPDGGCRALRAHLDHRLKLFLEDQKINKQSEGNMPIELLIKTMYTRHDILFDSYFVKELIRQSADRAPEAFVQHLLPWYVRAADAFASTAEPSKHYRSDSLFSYDWYTEHETDPEEPDFGRRLAISLQHIAQENPLQFREVVQKLEGQDLLAVQRLIAWGYLADPQQYVAEILDFLVADVRRLELGSQDYDSRRLVAAVFEYGSPQSRDTLDSLLLDLHPEWEFKMRAVGYTQYRFFKSVRADRLSQSARRKVQELERKFPDIDLSPPNIGGVIEVTAPIPAANREKMTDDAWLQAMRRYDSSTGWGQPNQGLLTGGIVELSRALTEHVEKEPERFFRLATARFDDTISVEYLASCVSGLAKSDAPAEWLFALVRQFSTRIEGRIRQGVCSAIKERAEDGVPADIIDLMEDWALHDPEPLPDDQIDSEQVRDPLNAGINSNRGVATIAVCVCALKQNPPDPERAFALLEHAGVDPSIAVRACVIERLPSLAEFDRQRVLDIFASTLDLQMLKNAPVLVHNLLYWAAYHEFARFHPYVETLLHSEEAEARQTGAQLSCLLAFDHAEADELALQAMKGDAAARKGAAHIYARNLDHPEIQEVCVQRLRELLDDPDKEVRRTIGGGFRYLTAESFPGLRSFICDFVASEALLNGSHPLTEFLKPIASDQPEFVLQVTDKILQKIAQVDEGWLLIEGDIAQLVLSAYRNTLDPILQTRAMDLFDQLLMYGSRSARKFLEDWDEYVR